MRTDLILTLLFTCISFCCLAQIDQDGTTLIGVTVECNNLDITAFENEIELLLSNYFFTNSDGSCVGVSYFLGSADILNSPPFTCGDQVELDIDVLCTGMPIAITVFIDVVDTEAPVINVTPSGNTFDCDDVTGIAQEVQNLLMSGTLDNCSGAPTDFGDFVLVEDLNDPSTWTINMNACDGTAQFTASYQDPCGNNSGNVSFHVDLLDTQPPVVISVNGGSPLPSGTVLTLNCVDAPFVVPTITTQDDCGGMTTHDNPIIIQPSDCSQNIIWEYDDIEDDCGNILPYQLEGDISSSDPLTNLMPNIGTGDCNVEFSLTIEECENQSPFCFDDPLVWVNNPFDNSPACTWPFFPLEGVVFEGGCPPYTYNFTPGNPAPGPGNVTVTDPITSVDHIFECIDLPYQGTVQWEVIDACGDLLQWSFDIDVSCINCPPSSSCLGAGNITLPPCTHCDLADVEADPTTPCHSCDATILDGFCSCTPPGSQEIDTSQFNNPLCDDGFVPNNMSWFSFTAGSPDLDLTISNVECIAGPALGVQTGIYAACELGECLAADNICGDIQDKSFSLSGLEVGSLYYIYVDGCAGSGCTFSISLAGQVAFILDEPIGVSVSPITGGPVNDICDNFSIANVCVGQVLDLRTIHDDSSPSEPIPPYNEYCATYDPDMQADYVWTIIPAMNDATMGTIGGQGNFLSWTTPDDGYEIPPLQPTNAGTYQICLEQVVTQCDVTSSRACVNLVVTTCSMDADNDGSPFGTDCDDNDPNNFPGNIEICDGQDNNCNGQIDEGFDLGSAPILFCNVTDNSITVEWDLDPAASIYHVFFNGAYYTSTPNNSITITGLTSGTSNEISVEIAFTTGCPSMISTITCTTDVVGVDNDGDGVPDTVDCDDNDPNNFPGNPEICDGQDNNCNNEIDEGFTLTTFYIDEDGDGFGNLNIPLDACIQPAGYVENPIDCDDQNPLINPTAAEICDGEDNDCNGLVDDGLTFVTYYSDNDMDGYGVDGTGFDECLQPPDTTTEAGDCDDNNPDAYPGAPEIPDNGIDEDCNGIADDTAIYELANATINIYPNPVVDVINIGVVGQLDFEAILFDMEGRELMSVRNLSSIRMEGVPVGTYVLMIEDLDSGKRIVERIVKGR